MRPLSTCEVAERLARAAPAQLTGLALLARLQQMERDGTLTTDRVLESQEQIERAVKELVDHAQRAMKVVERCTQLRAVPVKRTPTGF